jgi:NAD-dependent DNA ligase
MSLKGKKIVFTGFRDDDLKKQIEAKQGVMTTAVSNLTDIVVYDGEKGEKSDKKQKAEGLGKVVINKADFIKNIYFAEEGFLGAVFWHCEQHRIVTKASRTPAR